MKNSTENLEYHSTGIPLFDKQHLELLDAVAKLESTLLTPGQRSDLSFRKALLRLVRKLGAYFVAQEKWMRSAGICARETDKRSYAYFLRRLEHVTGELDNNLERASELSCFLKTWLIGHIRGINEKLRMIRDHRNALCHNIYEITIMETMPLMKMEKRKSPHVVRHA